MESSIPRLQLQLLLLHVLRWGKLLLHTPGETKNRVTSMETERGNEVDESLIGRKSGLEKERNGIEAWRETKTERETGTGNEKEKENENEKEKETETEREEIESAIGTGTEPNHDRNNMRNQNAYERVPGNGILTVSIEELFGTRIERGLGNGRYLATTSG